MRRREGRLEEGGGVDLSRHRLQHAKSVASVPSQSICRAPRRREFKYRYPPLRCRSADDSCLASLCSSAAGRVCLEGGLMQLQSVFNEGRKLNTSALCGRCSVVTKLYVPCFFQVSSKPAFPAGTSTRRPSWKSEGRTWGPSSSHDALG